MHNRHCPAVKTIIALMLAFLVTACTAMRLGYNNGESIGYYWLNGYADFQPEQSPWAKEHIADWFAWHRKTQLDDYAKLMASYQARLREPVTKAEILQEYKRIRQRAMAMANKALPSLANLALRLEPDQIAHLEDKFAANNKKFRKQQLSGDREAQQEFRYEKVKKQAEYWLGDLTDEQEMQIRTASDARPLNNELWLAERQQRQARLIGILKQIQAQKPSHAAVQAMLREYAVMVIEGNSNTGQTRFYETSRESTAQLIADIINLATPQQKAHASAQLQKWIEDFGQMSRKAGRDGA